MDRLMDYVVVLLFTAFAFLLGKSFGQVEAITACYEKNQFTTSRPFKEVTINCSVQSIAK